MANENMEWCWVLTDISGKEIKTNKIVFYKEIIKF